MTVFVKICGMTDADAIAATAQAGADAAGFVFADSVRSLGVRQAVELAKRLPKRIKKVAVMMHPTNAQWEEVLSGFKPDVLQTDLEDFAYLAVPDDIEQWPVLRESRMRIDSVLPEIFVYEGRRSGSGATVDWSIAAGLAKHGRMILAGGLDAANVAQAIGNVAPHGVDVSSGVESAPGRKDPAKIKAFIDAVRTAASPATETTA